MKRVNFKSGIIVLLMVILYGCGNNTTTEFLSRYAEFRDVSDEQNRAGIHIDASGSLMLVVKYSNTNINMTPENIGLLSERLFVADVSNPNKALSVSIGNTNISTTKYAPDGSVESQENTLATTIYCPETIKKGLKIIGFKGIDNNECAELATPPMFFLISFEDKGKKGDPVLMSIKPKFAGDFFDSSHEPGKFIIRTGALLVDGVSYKIGVYKIGKEDDGKTNIELFYNGAFTDNIYSKLHNDLGLPFRVEITVGGKTIKSNNRMFYTKGFMKLLFNTMEDPDTIRIVQDDREIVFDGKTKGVMTDFGAG